MSKVLVLPGDWIGPSIISSAVKVLEMMDDDLEVTYGSIGFDAYEATGHYIPHETLDLASEHENILCGPVGVAKDAKGSEAFPLRVMRVQLDLYATVRCFNTMAADLGVKDMSVTLWGSNTTLGTDIVETRDIDGITLTKYVRSSSYSRMMARALSDMEISGKENAVCVTRDDIFPESSKLFNELFNSLFNNTVYNTDNMNITEWASKVVRNPMAHDYVICADLYSNVAAGILSGMTGGNHLAPIGYVGDNHLLLTPGTMDTFEDMPPEYANPTSAIMASAMLIFNQNRRNEAVSIVNALKETYEAGDRTPDVGGDLTTEEFTSKVIARI